MFRTYPFYSNWSEVGVSFHIGTGGSGRRGLEQVFSPRLVRKVDPPPCTEISSSEFSRGPAPPLLSSTCHMTPLDGRATYQARRNRGPRTSINALKRTRREASSCFANTSAARRLARSVRRHHEDMREIHRGDSVIRGFVGAAIAWCLTCALIVPGTSLSQGQEPPHRIARVGFVDPESPANHLHGVEGFWQRLRELGWVEGQNLQIEARAADGRIDRLPALMNELVARKIDVLVTYSTPGAVAAKNATSTPPGKSARSPCADTGYRGPDT